MRFLWVSLLSFMCFTSLVAGCLEKSFKLNTGYRRDKLIFKTDFPAVSGEESFEWPANNTFLVGGEAALGYRNFFFKAEGDYGFIRGGTTSITSTSQTIPNFVSTFSNSTESFTSGTPGGYVFDVSANVGYWIYLRKPTFSFAPVVGYSLHKQAVSEENLSGHTNQVIQRNPPTQVLSDDTETRTVDFTWHGAFTGIDLNYQISSSWNASAGYAFHFGYSTIEGNAFLHLTQVSPVVTPPPQDEAIVFRKLQNRKATGQSVKGTLLYTFLEKSRVRPRLGATFEYGYFSAKEKGAVAKIDDLDIAGSLLYITGTGLLKRGFWQFWKGVLEMGIDF